MNVEKMLEALSHFPPNSRCVPAKEGEVEALEIRTPEGEETLGYIPTTEPSKTDSDGSDVVF